MPLLSNPLKWMLTAEAREQRYPRKSGSTRLYFHHPAISTIFAVIAMEVRVNATGVTRHLIAFAAEKPRHAVLGGRQHLEIRRLSRGLIAFASDVVGPVRSGDLGIYVTPTSGANGRYQEARGIRREAPEYSVKS